MTCCRFGHYAFPSPSRGSGSAPRPELIAMPSCLFDISARDFEIRRPSLWISPARSFGLFAARFHCFIEVSAKLHMASHHGFSDDRAGLGRCPIRVARWRMVGTRCAMMAARQYRSGRLQAIYRRACGRPACGFRGMPKLRRECFAAGFAAEDDGIFVEVASRH